MKLLKLIPMIALVGCATTQAPEIKTRPIETESAELQRLPRLPSDRPNNWSVERKVNGDDRFVISRSLEPNKYMWLTCKIETDGTTGLSLGVVQPDDIGYRGDDAVLVFMVDGREIIFGPAVMVNTKNAGMRSFDPRMKYTTDPIEREMLVDQWLTDEARIAQYEVIQQMYTGDFIEAEVQLPGIRRNITVDLQGFTESAHQVITACNATL